MFDSLNQWFDGGDFLPHGHCYLWIPSLVRLHLFTDLAIGTSYVAISLTLIYLVRRARNDMPFSWIFVSFGAFIIACGGTHFMEVWTLWTPVYWLSGAVKLVTAAASVLTALVLPSLVPKTLALIRAAKSSESAMAALQREVTERKRYQEEIQALNAGLERRVDERTAQLAEASQGLTRMAAIVACSNDAISSLDLDGTITSWNPAAERMYGYRAGEILGRSVTVLAPPDLCGETSGMMERVKRGERVGSFETTRVRKAGERLKVQITLSPIQDDAGEMLGSSIISRDITERERAQEMLRLAVEAAANAMVMVDEHGKIVLVNSQTEKLFGYLREELIGQEVDILVRPKSRGMLPGRDLCGLRKDGSEFPVEMGLNPIETDRGTWVLSAILDITERKRVQEEIQRLNQDLEGRVVERTQALTTANAELEAFSYSVSHDLRAPLRQIAGFSNIVIQEHGSELTSESRRHLQKVIDGAQQMGTLIDDLLNLSKIGRHQVARRPAALNQLLNAALEDLKIEAAGHEIKWDIQDLGSLDCDAGLVRQVFVNLLSNAIKYTRGRDRAVIQVGRTTIEEEPVIFIRDNGAGFDMRYAGKLFGVFQRLHKTEDFEGTGVGLATVQRIIHKHGGRIWADAGVDKGAVFFFTIPRGNP